MLVIVDGYVLTAVYRTTSLGSESYSCCCGFTLLATQDVRRGPCELAKFPGEWH